MKQLLTLVLAAMAFVACTQNDVEELTANRADVPETLTVGFEGGDTRIELNEALKTVWTEGDEVSVFYRSYENMRWAFQGETGDRSGEVRLVSGEAGEQTMDNVVVVYPYSETYVIDITDGYVEASLPAVQSYKEGSYGAEGNIMVAESDYRQFILKSVVGWLRVELTGEGESVKSITLRGNAGEQLAGDILVNAADASCILASEGAAAEDNSEVAGNLMLEESILTEITLNCGSGVELGSEAKAFYIGLLPQTFESGVTIEVNCAGYKPMTLSTESSITIERNHIKPMEAVEYEADSEPTTTANQLWYTATALVEPYNTSAFNVAIVSNEWDEATGEGIITFDGELTTIGSEAFGWCYSLTSVTIPDSVTTIGGYAFSGCYSLTSVTIPDSVTTIGNSAFENCSSLTSVTIPDSVTTIESYAFKTCYRLTSVTIPDSVTTIGDYAFSECDSLTSVTIGDSVTTIGEGAFFDCNSLTSVTIGDSVTTIGEGVFFGCHSLTSVTIPDSVTTIGDGAFSECHSLTSVTIPDSVTTIGKYAFGYCSSLTSVYCKATTPPSLGTGVFIKYEGDGYVNLGCAIYVPAESVEEYKSAAYWSDYAADIVGYNFETGEVVE